MLRRPSSMKSANLRSVLGTMVLFLGCGDDANPTSSTTGSGEDGPQSEGGPLSSTDTATDDSGSTSAGTTGADGSTTTGDTTTSSTSDEGTTGSDTGETGSTGTDTGEGCVPECPEDAAACGDDGCGGSCGLCGPLELCQDGLCTCSPQCDVVQCGPDPVCGEPCATCPGSLECIDGGCGCDPQCGERQCGASPGCPGVSCGVCPAGETCNADGRCECEPRCDGVQCGPDPVCGVECAACPGEGVCTDGACDCIPQCDERQCGPDPRCGVSCGVCDEGQACNDAGECECIQACGERQCGVDPVCGMPCGPTCDIGYTCTNLCIGQDDCDETAVRCTTIVGWPDMDERSRTVGGGLVLGHLVRVPAGTVTLFGMRSDPMGSLGRARMALYGEHPTGGPLDLVASTEAFDLEGGLQYVPPRDQVEVPEGEYWLMMHTENDTTLRQSFFPETELALIARDFEEGLPDRMDGESFGESHQNGFHCLYRAS